MTITAKLGSLAIPIDSISPYPGNPRQGDIGAISESLVAFGQVKPVVVQTTSGHIVAGNHLWRAAKALGWRDIAAVFVPMDDKEARRFVIADNRTQELGSYDHDALVAMLSELAAEGLLAGTGYDGDDVDELLRSIDITDAAQGGGRGRSKVNVCAFCGAEASTRFQLKLQWQENGEDKSRGAGSMSLCETDWLAHAQPNMNHPVDSIEALKGTGDVDDENEA